MAISTFTTLTLDEFWKDALDREQSERKTPVLALLHSLYWTRDELYHAADRAGFAGYDYYMTEDVEKIHAFVEWIKERWI